MCGEKCLKTFMEIIHSNGNSEVKSEIYRIQNISILQRAAARAPKIKIAKVISADEVI